MLLGLLAFASIALAASAGTAATPAATTNVSVSEREWSIVLGRLKAPRGTIVLNIRNFGQDDHNVAIRKNGVQYAFSGRILAGESKTISVKLGPGVYNVICTLPGHRSLGMATRLTVT